MVLNQSAGQQPLASFLPALASDPRIREAVARSWPDLAEQILKAACESDTAAVMQSGAYDLMSDMIQNDSTVVEEIDALGSSGHGEQDTFSIEILQFGPAYWIKASQFDAIGYFDSAEGAVAAAQAEYDTFISAHQLWSRDELDAEGDDPDEYSDDAEAVEECSFCGSPGSCEHHLLNVDIDERSARGGALYHAFSQCWIRCSDAREARDGDAYDEREAFEECLKGVSSLADAENEVDFEGGPALSTTYRNYYCSSAERVAGAVARFVLDAQL